MLADRNEDFASQMTAFLSTMELVLEVNSSSSILGKQLCKLQDCRQPSVTGITISYDRPHVINIRSSLPFVDGHLSASIEMLPVMHLLSLEQPLDLVWYRVIRVVSKV